MKTLRDQFKVMQVQSHVSFFDSVCREVIVFKEVEDTTKTFCMNDAKQIMCIDIHNTCTEHNSRNVQTTVSYI